MPLVSAACSWLKQELLSPSVRFVLAVRPLASIGPGFKGEGGGEGGIMFVLNLSHFLPTFSTLGFILLFCFILRSCYSANSSNLKRA